MPQQPVPTATVGVNRANHVDISVSDLDHSLRFHEALTGETATPKNKVGGPRMAGVLGLERTLIRYATMHLQNLNIDLLQYDEPTPKTARYAGDEVSAMHLCFEVDDLDAVHRRMVEAGLRFEAEPITLEAEDGLAAGIGTHVACFDDPDGTHLELIQPVGLFRRKE